MTFRPLTEWTTAHPIVTALGALALALVAGVVALRLWKASSKDRRKLSAGTLAAIVAFIVCTSVSLNTGYRFTGDAEKGLGMTSMPERILACAAFESLIAMCVLGARERMARAEGDHSPGWYGSAVWTFAALSAVPAWAEGGGFGPGTLVRIIVGSFGSALAAHSALGLELRHRTGGESQTAMAQIIRELRERLMARMGLAHRALSAQEIAQDRAMSKAVDLADRYERLGNAKTKWRGRRIARRMGVWQDRAGVSTDDAQRDLYRQRVAHRQFATALHVGEDESPWAQPSTAQRRARGLADLEEHTGHIEDLADEAEAALLAHIGTPGTVAAAHGGTSLPAPRAEALPPLDIAPADEEEADCIDGDEESTGDPATAAAAHGGTPGIITARVPQDADEDEPQQPERAPLRDLKAYPTKRAAIEALYAHTITDDGTRTTNAIVEDLLAELKKAGITLDRGPANRYIGALRDPADESGAEAEDRELVDA
ncbi:hypothetical protein OG594_46800 [Streptomyces sp. NBC_01214]|uniref:hypothetical protein n=1 Tax=Streptomyces sp. NBC_01214 TaxID=2903777 RepID=UPI002253B614|nr:hypothetical protein [Streptomyces sp. NBC_01214]MCX4808966.1 hypothetical protein [Streptomyces sp. NBC_01214]